MQAAIEPLAVRQDEAFAALPRKMGAYIPLRNDYRLRVRNYFGSAPLEPGPEEPVADRFLATDSAMKSLLPVLSRQPRGLLVCPDDFEAWLGRTSRGRTGLELSHWLQAYFRRKLKLSGIHWELQKEAALSECGRPGPRIYRCGKSLSLSSSEAVQCPFPDVPGGKIYNWLFGRDHVKNNIRFPPGGGVQPTETERI